jgi:hydroxyacylglutathione hydrolase
MSQVIVTPVPCLQDNYAYLVHELGSTDAVIVDASESAPVLAALAERGLTARAVLSTHHHFEHLGGKLKRAVPELEIVGSEHDRERIPGLTRALAHRGGAELAGLSVRALSVPGHTLGAVAFVIGDAVFTGDTLFIAGCGRMFEGDAKMMSHSLLDELASLPDDTRVYCGHEYTVANARFAISVDGDNAAVRELLARAEKARAAGIATVPSTIADEKRHNPFLRVADPGFLATLGLTDPVSGFAQLRKAKDSF